MNNYQRQKLLNKNHETFAIVCEVCQAKRHLGSQPQWIDIKAFYTLHQRLHSGRGEEVEA